MSQNLTEEFLLGVRRLSDQKLDEESNLRVKHCIIDFLGAFIAGSYFNTEKNTKVHDYLGRNSRSKRPGLMESAFVNGFNSHVLELDDGVISAILHPGAPVISALIPVAKVYDVSGEKFIQSVVAGYEASVRLAKAIQPSHKAKGYHASASCGLVGATIAIATLLDFTHDQTKSALSAAMITAGGTLKSLEGKSELKPYNVAYASLNAIAASTCGTVGLRPPSDALNGVRGFLSMMSDKFNTESLISFTNHSSVFDEVYFKPYAACRYCHPSIDAILKIKQHHQFETDSIKAIDVNTYKWAVEGHDHVEINNVSSAKMSIPYSVAIALHLGKAGISEFTDELISDHNIALTTNKVKVNIDEKYTSAFPEFSMAKVKIVLNNDQTIVEIVDNPKGEPSNPMTKDEIEEKFNSLLGFAGKSKEESERILSSVYNLERDFTSLLNLI